jgi:endonuclease III
LLPKVMDMATTINKQKVVNHLFTALAKHAKGEAPTRPVLEQFLYAIVREGTTREHADQAFEALQKRFFDWNEVRVSSAEEIADVLGGLTPEPAQRAQRIIDFLQEVFETTFSFDLEPLQKKGLKQAAKQLSRYQAANDYAVAWVTQHSLGGHAIPLDPVALRVLKRLQLIEEADAQLEAVRAALEHQVPKTKGAVFVDLVSVVGQSHCHERDPSCPSCPLKVHCPSAATFKRPAASKKPR